MKRKIGICFGGYCPLHQGHLDLIMKSKKENDIVYVIICGFDEEPRALEIGLPLRRRISLVRKLFLGDEQIRVLELNDSDLGIDESMSQDNWKIWTSAIKHKIQYNDQENDYLWYLAEENYKENLEALGFKVCLMERINPISGTAIRKNPLKLWNKIAWTFRPYFSTNILITGTASEGKSTLTRDIATYFSLPYSTEYGRNYMGENGKTDIDLTINDFLEFLIEQRRQTKKKIESPGNQGIVISDTDNLVTLMYARAYVDDPSIDLTKKDYDSLLAVAKNLQRGITWDKIFLLPPKNNFVDDGLRYMAQSSIEERTKNYNILTDLLHEFGWWDKVEIINGNFLENFETVKSYINSLRDVV